MSKSTFKDLISRNNIEIPVIQRDYVQGRGGTAEELDKREAFADKLVGVLNNNVSQYNLEFIYGAKDEETCTFVPLDGQQRLTTLFLLHWVLWYKSSEAAKRAFPIEDLKKFSYETRLSSANFCKALCKALIEKGICVSDDSNNLKELIENQPWFSEDWRYDPTISAMLGMIDSFDSRLEHYTQEAIDFMAKNTEAITFDEIKMSDYGLTDALYIRMNARGKQLTKFENWKSDFIKYLVGDIGNIIFVAHDTLRNTSTGSYRDYFSYSIEHEWTDLFWSHVKSDAEKQLCNFEHEKTPLYPGIDGLFMNFLDSLCMYSYYLHAGNDANFEKISLQEKRTVWQRHEFIDFFMKSLDSMYRIRNHSQFFEDLFYISDKDMPESCCDGKVRLFKAEDSKNLFKICVDKGVSMEIGDLLLFVSLLKYCNKFKVFEVNDSLKAYMREARNFFESELQNTKTQTRVQSNLRAERFAFYNSHIDNLVSRDTFNMPSEEMRRIEDCRFIRGNVSAFEAAIKQYGEKATAAALDEFCKCCDLLRIRLLISCGFRGTHLGYCIGRKRYFFGKDGKWDVVFISDSDNLNSVFLELTGKYIGGSTTDEIIDKALEAASMESFAYYMLKDDSFANANKYMYHFAVKGDIDDVDLVALGSYKSNPGMAYHNDPLAVAVAEKIKKDYPDASISVYGLYSNKCPLIIKDNNEEYFGLLSCKDGWKITVGQELITEDIKARFHIVSFEKEKLIPKSQREKDMVETGVDVLKSVLSRRGY